MGGAKKRSLSQIEKQQSRKKSDKKSSGKSSKSSISKKIGGIDPPNIEMKTFKTEFLKIGAITPYTISSKYGLKLSIAKEYLKDCTDFVRHMDLVSLPEEPVKVIVMPEFARGLYVAYCDAPGPLEKMGETFFAISPAPTNWKEEQVTSLFKEYNNYMLQNLTIHEAMPGHYLQLAHANKFRAPTNIRMIFESGTFIEGWATYSEQLMVEKGYGGLEVKMQQLKMRLRLIINAIIDQKIHTQLMTEQEAMDMMMNEGFQQ